MATPGPSGLPLVVMIYINFLLTLLILLILLTLLILLIFNFVLTLLVFGLRWPFGLKVRKVCKVRAL